MKYGAVMRVTEVFVKAMENKEILKFFLIFELYLS
jgi:hypothetical protein